MGRVPRRHTVTGRPNGPDSRRRAQWTLAATILGSSLTFIDGTVVNVALPALQSDLHATITDVQWVIEAYALFLGGLILVGGSLGDQLGRKRMFLLGVTIFTAASVACGLAQSTRALIVARGGQGVGAAFLVPGSLAIISATFDEADRGRAIGTWSGFSGITTAIGPVVRGWLIEHVTWRAVFGILLVRAFDANVTAGLDRMQLSLQKRAAVDQELPKLAGADLESPSLTAVVAPAERVRVRRVIDESFVAAFRVVMAAAAVVAMAAGVAGFLIR